MPDKYRNPFQAELMRMMSVDDSPRAEKDIDMINGYFKTVSDIIDNPENAVIRDLILHGDEFSENIQNHTKNYEAATLVRAMLDQNESRGQFSKAA